MMSEFKPGTKFLLRNKSQALYMDASGNYNPIREIVVGVVGWANDWAAYRGFVPTEMDEKDAVEIIAAHGDKIGESSADELANYCGYKELSKLRYRD